MSDSVWPHRRQPTRLPHPWDSGKNTGVGCHFFLQCMKVKSEGEVAQSCLTLSDPMDCSLLGSSVHGIFQARVLEWHAIAFSVLPVLYPQCLFWKLGPVLSKYILNDYSKINFKIITGSLFLTQGKTTKATLKVYMKELNFGAIFALKSWHIWDTLLILWTL